MPSPGLKSSVQGLGIYSLRFRVFYSYPEWPCLLYTSCNSEGRMPNFVLDFGLRS